MITKKTVYNLFPLIMIIFLCSSCNRNTENNKVLDYSAFTNNDTEANVITPTDTIPDSDLESTADEITDTPESLEWPFDMEFSGVKSEIYDYKLGNLSTNYKLNNNVTSLICPDTVNDIIYYINIGKDNYIYQLKNEEITLLVELKANNLQLWDNKIYFINVQNSNLTYTPGDPSFNTIDNYYWGFLYSYDLVTKELKVILEKNITSFFIDNYGIYYNELTNDKEIKVNRLDFNNTASELAGYPWILTYNEYLLTYLDGYLTLINRNKNDEVTRLMAFNNEYVLSTLHICDNNLIFVIDARFFVINLMTGARKVYDVNASANGADVFQKVESLGDFVVINNAIYCANGGNIIRIDLASDNIKEFLTGSKGSYSDLHTDGERLFALRSVSDWAIPGPPVVTGLEEIIMPPEGNSASGKALGR